MADQKLPRRPKVYTVEEWAEYNRDPCSFCIKELRSPSATVRCNAADILRGLAWDAAPAIPALIEACGDKDIAVRKYCLHAFYEIAEAVHSRVPKAVPSLAVAVKVLIESLTEEDSEDRSLAAQALGAVGAGVAPAKAKLKKLLKDEEDEVRDTTEDALASIEAAK